MKIKELFNDKKKWTQYHSARDSKGFPCKPTASAAVCWCLSGAIQRCYPHEWRKIDRRLIVDVNDYISWNDSPDRTFEEVKALVEKLDI